MKRTTWIIGVFTLLVFAARPVSGQTIGKYVPIAAGSDADHALTEINAATDPAQKLALIDKFSTTLGQGDMAIVADDLYVNYYLAQKNYDKAFEHGDKLFALDPDNFANALNMVRAASEKGDIDKLMSYGEKVPGILQRFKATPAPEGVDATSWQRQLKDTLDSNKDNILYIEQALYLGAYRVTNPAKRAALLTHFAELFPDSAYADPALVVAASAYQQAGKTDDAIASYEKLLSQPQDSIGWEPQQSWLAAHCTLAADYLAKGDREMAKQHLSQLLNLWKEADSNLPLVKQAKDEYAKALGPDWPD